MSEANVRRGGMILFYHPSLVRRGGLGAPPILGGE